MVAKITGQGRTVIPEAIRLQARIRNGDEMDVGYVNGLIVMRKREPVSAARLRKLLLAGRRLPQMTSEDETTVARAIQHVRRQRAP